MRESAFLLRGVKITLTDERAELQQRGLLFERRNQKKFVDYLNEEKDTLTPVVYFFWHKRSNRSGSCFPNIMMGIPKMSYHFVNNDAAVKDGGTHEVGMKISL